MQIVKISSAPDSLSSFRHARSDPSKAYYPFGIVIPFPLSLADFFVWIEEPYIPPSVQVKIFVALKSEQALPRKDPVPEKPEKRIAVSFLTCLFHHDCIPFRYPSIFSENNWCPFSEKCTISKHRGTFQGPASRKPIS